MTTFRIGQDWDMPTPGRETVNNLFDGLVDAAAGKPLPGVMGLVQALVCCWSQPRHNTNRYLHGTKLALNTAGIVRRYREVNNPTATVERKDPVSEYLTAKRLGIPDELYSLGAFVLAYSARTAFTDEKLPEVDDCWIRTFTLSTGQKYVYVMRRWNEEDAGTGPYVERDRHVAFMDAINELVWNAEGGADLQLSTVTGDHRKANFALSNIGMADDYVDDGETCRNVDKLARRCRAFAERGVGRNILLYGPPGTGKTTLGRRIAREIGNGRTLRIEAKAIDSAGTGAVLAFAKILRPRVIMFDDMDRCMGVIVDLLHMMEQSNRSAMLTIIGTVNVIVDVDPALLRPGRFDEAYLIGEPEEAHRVAIITHYAAKFGVDMDVEALAVDTNGFSQADIREVVQSAATVGVEYLADEVARVKRQRGLYAGDACLRYNDRKAGRETKPAVAMA